MNVKGYDAKERFEFGVITSFGYPIEGSGEPDPLEVPSEPMLTAR